MKFQKSEKNLILTAIQYEKGILNPAEYFSEDNSTIKSIENEINKQHPTFSIEQLNLIIDYLDLILEKNNIKNKEALNLQHKIKGYLQTM